MFHSGALRRRIHHEDVGGRKYERTDSSGSDGLHEPLLDREYESPYKPYDIDEDENDWSERKRKEEMAWTQILTRLLAQWAQFFATFLLGSGSWAGHIFFRTLTSQQANGERIAAFDLTPIQEERLQMLQRRLEVPFDGTCLEHQEALRELWQEAFPDRHLVGLVSEQWKDMGWQGRDPSTDFRGGGFVSLENLVFLAKRYPKSFQKLLHKKEGKRAEWEYPFAIAGINISFMLIQMLDLRSVKPSSSSGMRFLRILEEDAMAFDHLFCVAFEMMDAQWLAMRASYMEFNAVLKATQVQLERELSLDDVCRVEDLPAFNLLCS